MLKIPNTFLITLKYVKFIFTPYCNRAVMKTEGKTTVLCF